jgi:hypothetical protein
MNADTFRRKGCASCDTLNETINPTEVSLYLGKTKLNKVDFFCFCSAGV